MWSKSKSSISIKAQHTRATSVPLHGGVWPTRSEEPGFSRMTRSCNLAAVCLCRGAFLLAILGFSVFSCEAGATWVL